ncbi:calcium-binding protein [Donghicola sp. C2-DW-16]|uniref:Calcium-binding protein n=1 Tax=Donghicola mangrovi TaxID=2729614 RepID=A0ABX2PEY0_9RHOB|nr:calcium-binding protein [Donghicola mangrovi]NVO28050.1 calcium-binding protein [Donghicola mangrovi]
MANINLFDRFSSIIFTYGFDVTAASFLPQTNLWNSASQIQSETATEAAYEEFYFEGDTYYLSVDVEEAVYAETANGMLALAGNDLSDFSDSNGDVYAAGYFGEDEAFAFMTSSPLSEKTVLNSFASGQSLGTTLLAGHNVIVVEDSDTRVDALGGNDWVIGGDGADSLNGGTGNDLLYGNYGRDVLNGDDGNDQLFGAENADTLNGGNGNDLLFGGDDWDKLYGDEGADSLYGEDGNDTLTGGTGTDLLSGDWGWDHLYGGQDKDKLYGGANSDYLNGGGGRDKLFGQDGDDTLLGGTGLDKLTGGKGDDTLTGGGGNDRFIFSGRAGHDTITDFDVDHDTIVLKHTGRESVDDLRFTQVDDDVLIGYGKGKILLLDTTLDDATHGHYVFG